MQRLLATALLLTACTSDSLSPDAAPTDAGPADAFVGSVSVRATVVGTAQSPSLILVGRPNGRSCCDPTGLPPLNGLCEFATDAFSCDQSCPPLGCVTRIEVRRGGSLLGSLDAPIPAQVWIVFPTPGLLDPGPSPATLTFVGCGAPLVVDLPTTIPPTPELNGYSFDDGHIRLDLTAPPESGQLLVDEIIANGFVKRTCMLEPNDHLIWFSVPDAAPPPAPPAFADYRTYAFTPSITTHDERLYVAVTARSGPLAVHLPLPIPSDAGPW